MPMSMRQVSMHTGVAMVSPEPAATSTSSAVHLLLLQLASPGLPIGGYSYSEGLETLVQRGVVQDVATVEQWLQRELACGTIRVDVAALHRCLLALQAGDRPEAERLDRLLLAHRGCEAMRNQQRQMGRSLLLLLQALTADQGCPPGPWPRQAGPVLAWALAAHHFAIPAAPLLEAFLFSWTANLISAAVRLVPLAATDGQRLQLRLQTPIAALAAAAPTLDPDDLWPESMGPAMAQLGHGSLYSRLFRS